MMDDWKVSGYVDPDNGGTWVYYENPAFPDIHMSRSVDNPARDHMATNDRTAYYYGSRRPPTFNNDQLPEQIRTQLVAAWRDYYTV
ncbi:hypothetical protein [Cupriavidus sp. CP313]